MAKKPTTTTPKPRKKGNQDASKTVTSNVDVPIVGQTDGVYIGVATGSELETYGYQLPVNQRPSSHFSRNTGLKPRYQTNYMNSQQFYQELNLGDPNVIYLYQQRMSNAGLLDAYTPGQLDNATRAAFKNLMGTANQTATTWQQTLQDAEAVGGSNKAGSAKAIVLDDPTTLRSTFQAVARKIYGGDLPDDEVNRMVDAYRNMQAERQRAMYDAQASGGTTDSVTDPSAYAEEQINAQHPDQANRVKFQNTLSTIMQTFSKQAP